MLLLPGLGQFANKERFKGTIFIITALVIVFALAHGIVTEAVNYYNAIGELVNVENMIDPMTIIENYTARLLKVFLIWGGLALIVWAASGIDAYMVAKKQEQTRLDSRNPPPGRLRM